MNRYDYYTRCTNIDEQEWLTEELYYPEQEDTSFPPYQPSSSYDVNYDFYEEENEYAAYYGLLDDEEEYEIWDE